MSDEFSITFEQLVDLAEGWLGPAAARALQQRAEAHPAARANLAWLSRTIGLMRQDAMVDAPEALVRRAIGLRRSGLPLAGLLRRVTAALRFDSRLEPLAMGLRSADGGPRSLLFAAEDRELDLQIMRRGERWQITGQVLGPDPGGQVELVGPAGRVQAELSDIGEFVLAPVPAGRYALTLRQGDCEIAVPELELEP